MVQWVNGSVELIFFIPNKLTAVVNSALLFQEIKSFNVTLVFFSNLCKKLIPIIFLNTVKPFNPHLNKNLDYTPSKTFNSE